MRTYRVHETIYKDENIKIVDQHQDYDYGMYVENLSDREILFAIPGFDELKMISEEPIKIKPKDWFGLLCGEQDDDMEMLKIGWFEYKIAKTGYDLVKGHGFVVADGQPLAK